MSSKSVFLIGLLAAGLLVGSQSVFIVDETEQAIVLQLGQPVGEPRLPGLHLKIPFIQNVLTFDRRILSIDAPPEQVVIASTQSGRNLNKSSKTTTDKSAPEAENGPKIEAVSAEPIIVDTFARYKITDPLQFMKTLKSVRDAESRVSSIINDSARAVLGETTLQELLSQERTAVMDSIRERVNQKVAKDSLGIEIVDVRIVRADLTDELRESTVKQMNSALQERATERKAQGEQKALEIRSTADKESTVILAEAERDSQIIQGEGDREAIKIYASAFNTDIEFYSFIRSMDAYKNTFSKSDTQILLSPDGEFMKYFNKTE